MPATVTADLTAEHLRGHATAAPQLFVLFGRDQLDRPGSAHVLRGVDAVHLGRGAPTFLRTRAGGRGVLQLTLDDRRVSTTHARVTRGAREWIVEDAGSRNGTFLDGRPVRRATLTDGALIEIGGTFLLFRDGLVLDPGTPADREEAEIQGPVDLWRTGHAPLAEQYRALARLAPTTLSVLVQGETGAGKERVAEGLHRLSGRKGAFVPVNCATLGADLADSTLFGHRRGAFTGAAEARAGLFRRADGGTLFLDEVGELPPPVQARLLRVLETGELTPVGADVPVQVDVRVVTATHRDLTGETFREDLLARLAQMRVEVPPLRARREDLGLLLRALLPAPRPRLERDAALALLQATWPRNVRQLANALRVAHALAEDTITLRHLPTDLGAEPGPEPVALDPEAEARRAALVEALRATGGNVAEVARRLGRSRNSIHRWLRRFDLDPESFRG